MKHVCLEWVDQSNALQRVEILDRIFIGRLCKGIEDQKKILIDSPSVSRDHAFLERAGPGVKITDTGKNGTWLNGIRMAAGSTREIGEGDTFRIGESSFRLLLSEDGLVREGDYTPADVTKITSSEMIVTNLVADVRSFSQFSQQHPSSEVFDIVQEIFSTFSTLVNEHGGTIKDYAGDAVYAFWTHRVGLQENAAVSACRAAMAQLENFRRTLAKRLVNHPGIGSLEMGWGISTGPVTMSHYGVRAADMALVGDCINLGFRLSDLANKKFPDEIVICSQTAELVSESLRLKDLGEITVRGRTGREHIYALETAS